MKIEVYLICYNEATFIRHSLAHYTQYTLNITVYDNMSTDNTLEIIKKYFPHVKIMQFDTGGFFDDSVNMAIKNSCWKHSQADWVVIADMDELLYHPNLLSELENRKNNYEYMPNIEGYQMYQEGQFIHPDKKITQQVKHGFRDTFFDKNIIFNPQQTCEINYDAGAHRCTPKFKTINNVFSSPLYLLHYKYIGISQNLKRHKEYSKRLSSFNLRYNYGREYINAHENLTKKYEYFLNNKHLLKKIVG